ncbi:MAG: tryptophan--tRNA ligase, partial [Planctomycetota bacterium]
RQYTLDGAIDLLALGLDPDKATLFVQSDVPEVSELCWLLLTGTPMGLLERCVSYKDKLAKGLKADAGLFTYPVLQAADILAYDATVVPVGEDQLQHIEVCRDLAQSFNHHFGETFVLPKGKVLDQSARVPGTDGEKMSKSYGNTIPIFLSGKKLKKRVAGVVTDSKSLGDPLDPDTCNVFALLKLFVQGEELEQIAKSTLRSFQNGGGLNIDLRKSAWGALVDNLAGLSRRHARQLVGEVVALDRALTDDDVDALVERKRELLSSSGPLEFVRAPTSMDSIGGMANLKRWLEERARSFDDNAEAFGITPPRGVLLLGVQGAGKSLCAKAIATAWRRPLLRLDAGGLYDRYVGESEKRLRDALHQAERMSPVVLWIDEIEKAFASAAAQSTDGGLSKRMFGALLTWMQDHREPVFLVATANDIAALPPELIRKGRFDEIFFVDLPGDAARRQIWTVHLEKRGRDVAKFDLDALVAASAGYSGAEIEQAVLGSLHRAFASGKEPDTAMLAEVTRASPPLSVTMEEKIGELRAWVTGRCVPAE